MLLRKVTPTDISIGKDKDTIDTTGSLIFMIIKGGAAAGLVIASAMFLMHLARALFHEATILFNRRHALRFGRLFIYLKEGEISLEDLEKAFKWNDEFSTAFKDIRIDPVAPRTAIQSMTDAFDKAADRLSGVAANLGAAGKPNG